MFDVLVIGGGHAGCEAATAAARRGASVALVTFDSAKIGAMSCNPAIGGLGKGHLVREVDALDGLIGRAADAAAIHYRMLNRSKGPAVWGPRVQADRDIYAATIRSMIASQPGIEVVAGGVDALRLDSGAVSGAILDDGQSIAARSVVMASGTFLGGRMFRGSESEIGGRIGERGATALGAQLRRLGLPMGRMKTGTPMRIDGRTIDWSRLDIQPSDDDDWTMSPLGKRSLPQLFCAITRTNAATHDAIRAGLDDSPLLSGAIEGEGPRYCPSVEDKVLRFGDRDGHQVFLEPEGLASPLVYPNGLSTSLSKVTQAALLRTMSGLECAEIAIYGYAVEYDHIDPRALSRTLESRAVARLFCCGQINGTTGYEEAAAQGLVAGVNAAASALDLAQFVPDRRTSYIGVMVDDLALHGATEPYRMLTSRAEHRLALRADNAATRLSETGVALGLVCDSRLAWSRVHREDLAAARRGEPSAPAAVREVALDVRYAPYLARQAAEERNIASSDAVRVPAAFDWTHVAGLSNEMVERFTAVRPATFADVRRIRGVTPAALAATLVAVRRAHG